VLIVAAVALLAVVERPANAQSQCEEPTDGQYVERMEQLRVAIGSEDYETALEVASGAATLYDYAVLDYTVARAQHHLERHAEAIEAYNTFLASFEGCDDPQGLVTTARNFRNLAIRQQAESFEPLETEVPAAEPPASEVASVEPDSGLNPGWFVVGGGAALLATALIYDLSQMGLRDDKEAADLAGDDAEFYRIQGQIEDAQTVEWVLIGTGVVAGIVGVVLLVVEPDDEESRESVGFGPLNGGYGFTYGASF